MSGVGSLVTRPGLRTWEGTWQRRFSPAAGRRYSKRSIPNPEGEFVKRDGEGPRIVVTREREKWEESAQVVREFGGVPYPFPTIETGPVEGVTSEEVLRGLRESSWVVFTSERAVKYTLLLGGDDCRRLLGERKIAVVGKKTGEALEEEGLSPDFLPREMSGEGLGRELATFLGPSDSVFFPRARRGRREIISILEERGIPITPLDIYETRQPVVSEEEVERLLSFRPDAVTFTSPSTFQNFLSILGEKRAEIVLSGGKIGVIGKTTESAVRQRGYVPHACPEEPTFEALIRELIVAVRK
ncbi:MAG: uroporphyrinogen-III synthase [Deltaproteobacteria bacterium]|nr:MAG: uroporphyrinogen-III synthase [Deltaproteobacteria bacterium]